MPAKDRTVYLCDCDAFFASVEELYHPEFKQVPMAVCGNPENRHGIILAKNQLAKGFGVKTAETIGDARRKCPGLVLAKPHFERYVKYSKLAKELYYEYTDKVESFGMDECWLDVRGSERLFGTAEMIAEDIRKRVKSELNLTVSIGVSFNKVFAKLGSDYRKPDAVTVFGEENYKEIIWKMPAGDMLFVGPKTARNLAAYGIHTIGDIAQTDMSVLKKLCGRGGESMWYAANGLDNSPVAEIDEAEEIKSVGNSMTLPRDISEEAEVKAGFIDLAETVAHRLREKGKKCTEVQISIRSKDFEDIQRQTHINPPACDSKTLYTTAVALYRKEKPDCLIRGLGLRTGGLIESDEGQCSLYPEEKSRERQQKLEETIDGLSEKYGRKCVKSAMLFEELAATKEKEEYLGFAKV